MYVFLLSFIFMSLLSICLPFSSLHLPSLCVFHFCVSVSFIFVCASFCFFCVYVFVFVSLLGPTSFYNGSFFLLLGVALCLHFVAWCYVLVLCVVVIFVAIFLTHDSACLLFFLSLLYRHFHFLFSLYI